MKEPFSEEQKASPKTKQDEGELKKRSIAVHEIITEYRYMPKKARAKLHDSMFVSLDIVDEAKKELLPSNKSYSKKRYKDRLQSGEPLTMLEREYIEKMLLVLKWFGDPS